MYLFHHSKVQVYLYTALHLLVIVMIQMEDGIFTQKELEELILMFVDTQDYQMLCKNLLAKEILKFLLNMNALMDAMMEHVNQDQMEHIV